jgi:D-alanyl-D-alanine carboxypeptidase
MDDAAQRFRGDPVKRGRRRHGSLLARGRVLPVDGYGHGALVNPSSCANRYASDYPTVRGRVIKLAAALALLGALVAGSATPALGAEAQRAGSRAKARHVVTLARQSLEENGLNAVILRVDVGRRNLVTAALGRSMDGVPATRRMHFRIGSMAIPSLTTILLQLRDAGRLSLDNRLAKWFPGLPNADRITLRMLANSTSGWNDYAQGNDVFLDALFADVFRQWRPNELLDYAFARGPACDPGECFNYSHANFVTLSKVLREVTGKPVAKLMRNRVFRPLGLRNTDISPMPEIEPPVLHSYTADRGPYEDSTFWSPSWSIGPGTIQTSNIRDITTLARAVGTGALLSRRSHREQFAPLTAGLPPLTSQLYYGLGVLVTGSWRFQNPDINGYTGVMAYLPQKKISIGIVATRGQAATRTGTNYAEALFTQIGTYLAPGYPPVLPSG